MPQFCVSVSQTSVIENEQTALSTLSRFSSVGSCDRGVKHANLVDNATSLFDQLLGHLAERLEDCVVVDARQMEAARVMSILHKHEINAPCCHFVFQADVGQLLVHSRAHFPRRFCGCVSVRSHACHRAIIPILYSSDRPSTLWMKTSNVMLGLTCPSLSRAKSIQQCLHLVCLHDRLVQLLQGLRHVVLRGLGETMKAATPIN